MKQYLFCNGKVRTMDPQNPLAEAVLVGGGKILAVGAAAELDRLANGKCEKIDLKGRLVIPGLVDSHTHFAMFALGLEKVSLEGTKNVEEALDRFRAKVKTLSPGDWVLGVNWDKNVWPGGNAPTKEDADRALPDNPLCVVSKCGHLTWANSLAFKMAGITRDTPSPAGGEIEKNPATGEPTGILKENASALVRKLVPQPDQNDYQRAIRKAMKLAHSQGLVGVHNCEGAEPFRAFQALARNGELAFRVHHHIAMDNLDDAVALGLQTGFGSPTLNIGSLKLFADGALGSQTADMFEPYEERPDYKGIVVNTKEELHRMIEKAAAASISSAVHAIGDAANRKLLDIYEDILPLTRAAGLRQRIEHAQILKPEDFSRFAKLGVIASVQPLHATSDMHIVDRHWGKRGRYAYAFKSFIKAGAAYAYGSDVPVETFDPLKGIFAGVSRRREDNLAAEPWYPEEILTVQEAVYGYTMGAAYASYEENIKGSLTPGKLADLVVLSKDIFAVPADEILATQIDFTMVGGEVVHARA